MDQPAQRPPFAITDWVWDWFRPFVARLRAAPRPGWVWVVLLWALIAYPAVALRSAHYEEGTVIGLARGMLEDGHWLAPHLYGQRFVERPVLLSWITAAIGAVTGGVSLWSARIPHLAFLLAGALTVYGLVKPRTRTPPAVYAALCWLACTMVGQKFVTAEPDVTLSVLLFGAFVLWWNGVAAGRLTLQRWLGIAVLLGLAGLTKGPQPIAYFSLGVGAYTLLQRRWADIPGLILAHVIAGGAVASWYLAVMTPGDVAHWRSHSRLADGMTSAQWLHDHLDFVGSVFVEWLPGSLLIGPVAFALWRRDRFADNALLLALVLYAGAATLALALWPGGVASRYAMPANLALAALSGLMFDAWWRVRPWLIGLANTIIITLAVYFVLLGWVAMPLVPEPFRYNRTAALEIDAVRALRPGPLYAVRGTSHLITLVYVPAPVRLLDLADVARLTQPSWVLLTPDEIAALAARQAALRIVPHAALRDRAGTVIADVVPAP